MGIIKTHDEILAIKKAVALGDICMSYITGIIEPGRTETEIAKEIDSFLLENGAEALAFPTICVSGENTNQPHGVPTEKKIEKGDFLTLDFGGSVDGYCGDMTRTLAISEVSEKQRDIYSLVLKAQTTALEKIKSGVSCFDIDESARAIIRDAGYGDYFIHGTGHGVGREVHESPKINQKSKEILMTDMAVTVEPGIYIPGEFGVRIEDLVLITDDGIINFTASPKELIILQ